MRPIAKDQSSEPELLQYIHLYKEGNKEVFTKIYNQYFGRLYRFLVILTNNSSSIEDILQETFLKVALHLSSLKDEKKFKQWIFSICRNTALTYRKKEKLETYDSLSSVVDHNFLSHMRESLPEENAIQEERENSVREALARLTEEQRMVIILSRYEQLDYKEIGQIMDKSEDAIKQLVYRAMTRLSEFLGAVKK